jgi:adenosylmethionine-8-amino-7-oxononanoate aminotransferase
MNKAIFITGTDTGVGKTVATFVLGVLLQEQGIDVGVMKPVQCAGNDAQFLKEALHLTDPIEKINPFFAKEPFSPHIAFQRQGTTVRIDTFGDPALCGVALPSLFAQDPEQRARDSVNPEDTPAVEISRKPRYGGTIGVSEWVDKIIKTFQELQSRHEILLVEGAGGLLAPIKEDYLIADLVRDLGLPLIIVARLGLGTINHSLLTIYRAKEKGIPIQGIIFNTLSNQPPGIPEKTNPDTIRKLGGIPLLGTIPYLKTLTRKEVLRRCRKRVKVSKILKPAASPSAKRLEDWDKRYLWHPFTQMEDWLKGESLVIEEAKGCYLKDTKGRWYLDGVSSLWVNVHGHRKKEMDEALRAQLNKVSHSTLLGLSNTSAIQLAKELVKVAPKGLEKVFYSDNGSTAAEVAIKMAYQYWQNTGQTQKTAIVHLTNSYHGDTLGSVSVGGIDLFHKVYRKLIFKTISVKEPYLKNLEALFKKLHRTLAALIVEPIVQAAAGMLMWPEGTLKGMERLCRRYDVFLIADEVATGFGRSGKMFACEHEDVHPDFLCLAKGLTGGYLPLAATLTTKRVFDGFLFDYKAQKTFFHGHTYTGNPLASAVALANICLFKKERTLQRLQPKIKFLSQRLQMFYNLPHVGEVRQKGFMVGIELIKNKATKEPFPWEEKIGVRVCEKVRKYGVILRPLGNVIVLMPPLAISTDELEQLTEATYRAIREVTEKR